MLDLNCRGRQDKFRKLKKRSRNLICPEHRLNMLTPPTWASGAPLRPTTPVRKEGRQERRMKSGTPLRKGGSRAGRMSEGSKIEEEAGPGSRGGGEGKE